MKLGLIGRPLGHSWSPEIHRFFLGEDYSLWQLEEHELASFMERRDWDGINVTIPYKASVIPFLDEIDPAAERMGAVNCIVNRGGSLKGYNTDLTGLLRMIDRHGINRGGGRAAILGTGGASKATAEACRLRGWDHILVSRTRRDGCIDYSDLSGIAGSISLLINATPVGMYPDEDGMPEVALESFDRLTDVIDIVANPVRTRLCFEASCRGIRAFGGLEMLVSQALAADELFTGRQLDDALIDDCIECLLRERRNIVLIGMPSSGKSTVGRILAGRLGMRFVDTDKMITDRIGMTISEYFALEGEEAFRDIESDVCSELQTQTGLVIATGGGIIKRKDNMRRLSHRGVVVWLDRDPSLLTPTQSRPLLRSDGDIARLYRERIESYSRYSDIRIINNGAAEEAAEEVLRHGYQ